MTATQQRHRLHEYLVAYGDWIPSRDLIAWMRADGWENSHGVVDLQAVVRAGLVEKRNDPDPLVRNVFGGLGLQYRAVPR